MNRKGGRSPVPLFVAIALTTLGAGGRAARGAGPGPGASTTSDPIASPDAKPGTAVLEGPLLPPSPEQEQRLADLARALAETQARAAATAARTDEQLAAERAERQALQARVEAMEAAAAAAARRAEEAPPAVTVARAGLVARPGLSLTGFLQADFVTRQSAEDQLNTAGTPLNEDRFLIRRARVRAALEHDNIAGAIEFDGNTVKGPTARVLDAEASWRWPSAATGAPPIIMATIGAFKIPFGFEVIQSDRDRLFLERSTTERALFPGEYDLGARLGGGWRFIRYALAVMNGEPAGESSGFPGRDPNHQKDVVGRLGVDVPVVDRLQVVAGVSALSGYGFHPGTPATKPSIIWQDRNQDGLFESNEVSVAPGTAATPSANFLRQAIGADLRLVAHLLPLGETVAYGEVYLAKNLDRGILPADPVSLGRNLTELGTYLAVTQQLHPHAIVGFRYDYYNPDRDSTDTQLAVLVPQSFVYQTFAFTAALQSEYGRLIVEYDVNRNHLGRDATGLPTNLADNAFLLRGEAKF